MIRARLIPKLLCWVLLGPSSLLQQSCAHPPASPAAPSSPLAAEGTTRSVTRALEEDPPLPGAPAQGWPGLAATPPREDPHAAHRHGGHHGH